jgi:hypothetical protein
MITINTWWVDTTGNRIPDLPSAIYDVPIYAVFDRPILKVEDRVIQIGEVFPTLQYFASLTVSLLNSFPTDFHWRNCDTIVEIVFTDDIKQKRSQSSQSNKSIRKMESSPRASTELATTPSSRSILKFPEFARATPETGHLDLGESVKIDITAQFCTLGERALPLACIVTGGLYTCALLATVVPPRIKLLTELIDFSSDFVICKRSKAFVRVANECGVKSTAQLEMVDSCHNVFSLDDTDVHDVVDVTEFQVSCYSEIHGDYNGMLRLLIRDPWQQRVVNLPLHVKAMGSFFAFQKHTLGYTTSLDGDYISFGQGIKVGGEKVIRRLALANFSSEPIPVDWSISNLVKGRKYANLDVDVEEDGSVKVVIDEAENANDQQPFHLVTSRTIVESHGKTMVIVDFEPTEVGTFGACVAARSGEFMHTVGLTACVEGLNESE